MKTAQLRQRTGVCVLTTHDILDRLSEFKHRGAGTEEEELARETLLALLAGEYGVESWEEGVFVPNSPVSVYLGCGFALILSVWFFPVFPAFFALTAFCVFLCFLWRLTGRPLPLFAVQKRALSANIVAEKTSEPLDAALREENRSRPLVLLMAQLDSCPAHVTNKPEFTEHTRLNYAVGLLLLALAPFTLTLGWLGGGVPLGMQLAATIAALLPVMVLSAGYFLHGYQPGAGRSAAAVAAAAGAASRLWQDMPAGVDVRLLLTTGGEEMRGVSHYLAHHRALFGARRVFTVNVAGAGQGVPAYVSKDGLMGLRSVISPLTLTAKEIGLPATAFEGVSFADRPFQDMGIPAITLVAVKKREMVQHPHTSEDTFDQVDRETVTAVSEHVETFVRTLAGKLTDGKGTRHAAGG